MSNLLKDMPEFKERIEGNFTLKDIIKKTLSANIEVDIMSSSVKDGCISEIVEVLSKATFEIIDDTTVAIADKQGFAISIFESITNVLKDNPDIHVTNNDDVAAMVLDDVTEFVNDNYQFKGVK